MSDDATAEATITDNTDPPKSETAKLYEGLAQGIDYYSAPDLLLLKLADSADHGGPGKGIPITLFLHGGMIAGHITSSQDFYRGVAQIYRDGLLNLADGDGKLREFLNDYAKDTFDSVADDADTDIESDAQAFTESGIKTARWLLGRHLYLTNAAYTVPGAQSVLREYVNVKLSHVVGWTLGITTWG